MIDTTRTVETPEGVALEVRVAGPVPRCLAWIVDQMARMGLYLVLGVTLPWLGDAGAGLFLLAVFAAEWLYPVFFEVGNGGVTPGKRVMGLRVVRGDGGPVGWSASLLRNLLRFADFLPFGYAIGLASMALSRDFQRLGDVAAGTVVVYDDRRARPVEIPAADGLAPAVPLSLAEQRAIIAFAERKRQWTAARADELAGILRPLTGSSGADGATRLVGMATWLWGRR